MPQKRAVRSGAKLEAHYSEGLAALGAGDDMLGVVFGKARNRIQAPAKLEQLVKGFIDKHEWLSYADRRRTATSATTSGLPPATSSSTSCSTS